MRASEVLKGYLAEVRVLPTSLLLSTALLGGLFAAGPRVDWGTMGLVLLNAFLFLYTAHLNDTYWDLRRGEYEPGRRLHSARLCDGAYLPRWGFGLEVPGAPVLPSGYYLAGIAACSALGLAVMAYLSALLGWAYSALAVVGLALALSYSAGLDRVPVLGDTAWEAGVLFALFCGYYSQRMALDQYIVMTAVPLFVALIGVKLMDSLPDAECDDRVGKLTLAVLLKRMGVPLRRIRDVAFAPVYAAFSIMALAAPPMIAAGALASLLLLALVHALLRRDVEGRLTIVAVCFIILGFITWSALNLACVTC